MRAGRSTPRAPGPTPPAALEIRADGHDPVAWLLDLGALAGLTVLFALLTAVLLRRVEPICGRRRR
ncbi:hypothetical protein [Actinomycetospora straminea]|uniref:Uncharacterized protein n=1 Tax=Actinomycetospora straminea TaxID=663607 RepID=A0ABP9DYR5_9PSEU|nr:hypothetical protein [Actinomycetospora straminea]MDD7930970.1 hypothetical protein [Actinomycetospora straminea]